MLVPVDRSPIKGLREFKDDLGRPWGGVSPQDPAGRQDEEGHRDMDFTCQI